MNICPSTSSQRITVRVEVKSLSGVKLADSIESGKVINFDVKAWMEEKERRAGWVKVDFALSVGTKPNIVKFEVEGTTTLDGKDEDIRNILEPDPETQIPLVFQRVYQHVFMSMYLLATLIDAPYPPANLLYSNQQQIANLQMSESSRLAEEKTQQEASTKAPSTETIVQQPATSPAPYEEKSTSESEEGVEVQTETQTSVAQSETRPPSET